MLPDFLTAFDWGILVLCAMLIGLNKAGLRGVNIIVIPIFATYFGGKSSASIILPLLVAGDITAIFIYHKKISWIHFLRLLPAAMLGLIAGMILGQSISDETFRLIMAVLVLICLILMIYKEFSRTPLSLPDHWASHALGGFSGGFTTMVGNAAGPIMAVYLLSMNLPKEIFIGTGAVFFLVVNLLKIPIHLFVWKTMLPHTLLLDAVLVPFVMIGMYAGLKIVKRIPEKPFRLFIIFATLTGTIKLFLS
ncbi:MAG: hypothetical protein B6241_07480 [Spirochaetaceae bacterium 4572_59]|nr:MAG: hypothetical protein B6241_07480 [Spirochaetaceae bacterium 4572_59]